MAPPPRPTTPRSSGGTRAGKTPRGVLQVDWAFFGELCRVLALKVFREYDPEVVIGIAKAGVVPGAAAALLLQPGPAPPAPPPHAPARSGRPPPAPAARRLAL